MRVLRVALQMQPAACPPCELPSHCSSLPVPMCPCAHAQITELLLDCAVELSPKMPLYALLIGRALCRQKE